MMPHEQSRHLQDDPAEETPSLDIQSETLSGEGKRDRSTVKFPYVDLEDAIELPNAIWNNYGDACDVDQLAAQIGHSTTKSGAFARRISGAQQYGLISRSQSRVFLTELGKQIVQPDFAPRAKVDAFLSVELFGKIFNQFKGQVLPGDKGLEATMQALGVAPKAAETARQIMRRAAEQAGLSYAGKDRLVIPPLPNARKADEKGADSTSSDQNPPPSEQPNSNVIGDTSLVDHLATIHPSLAGMLKDLPAKGTKWAAEDFELWNQTFQSILTYAYKIKPFDPFEE